VVLSPWWTPGPGTPDHVRTLRPVAEAILARVDIPTMALEHIDAWATSAGLPELLSLDGVSWWDRVRMAVRWELDELIIWRYALEALAPAGRYRHLFVPADRPALAAAARALGFEVDVAPPLPAPVATPDPTLRRVSVSNRIRRRIAWLKRGGKPRPSARELRTLVLDRRFRDLAARPGVLSIAWAGAFQVVDTNGERRAVDPYLAPTIDRLAAEGTPVTVVVMGRSHKKTADWAMIEADRHVLPMSYVTERWRDEADDQIDSTAIAAALDALPCPPLLVDGCDLGPSMRSVVRAYLGPWLDERRRWTRCAERCLAELRPGALFIDREGTRVTWIAPAQRLGIPVVSVQHGMIYPGTPEYCAPRHAGTVRPDRTCVFGEYERDILLEQGGYRPDEIVVTGSPRSDLADAVRSDASSDRDAVRAELGIAAGDRLLVISVAHNTMGELHSASMIARLLNGPLPGTHVVIKLHPQDRAEPAYVELIRGLAAAGGYAPPPVSVVRDIDLYRLLAAADAHLSQNSTVLTDAVVAGVPNMVGLVQAQADPIGYVGAGVAVGVSSVAEVRAFMADPQLPTSDDRAAFLAAHFRPGDAAARIADVIGEVGRTGRPGAAVS
jgi:hypothetical protein